jgi:hypothetical protein
MIFALLTSAELGPWFGEPNALLHLAVTATLKGLLTSEERVVRTQSRTTWILGNEKKWQRPLFHTLRLFGGAPYIAERLLDPLILWFKARIGEEPLRETTIAMPTEALGQLWIIRFRRRQPAINQ